MITDWLIAVGTVTLAVVAAFQDKIRSWIMSPKLEVSINTSPPDCHKTTLRYVAHNMIQEAPCYYFRLRVKNSGNGRAEMVEVFASELLRERADGTFAKMDSFLPMNLVWSHIRRPFFEAISPGMEKHCDLGHIAEPIRRQQIPLEDNPQLGVPSDKTIFSFDLQVLPYTYSHLIPPGKYQLALMVAAANTNPVEKRLEITLKGDWYNEEARMLRDGIGIRML